MSRAVFITGTDTEIGKTYVSRLLLQALTRNGVKALGMKPVASGCEDTPEGLRNEDVEALLAAGSHPVARSLLNPYAFRPAVSPHIAAARAGIQIDFSNIKNALGVLQAQADIVVVEGAGGWFAPVSDCEDMADLATALDLPVILVVGMRLGCINHARLSAAAILASGRPLLGWVANHVDPTLSEPAAVLATLQARMPVPMLASLRFGATIFDDADLICLLADLE